MPVHGQPDFLQKCLESMQGFDAGTGHTVTLVDDVSPKPSEMEEVFAYARGLGYTVVRNSRNLGFAGTCNRGAKRGKSPLVLLLNTDILIVHDNWLKAMADEFRSQKVGVVGALLTYFPDSEHPARPAGKVQHAGVCFDILGRPYHIFMGWSADHPKVAQRREMNCVTGACLMTRRSLWKRLGGLDTDYGTGNFEDVQYCVQAKLAGRAVVFTPEAHLHHFAGGSNNSATAKRNAQIFQLKMGRYVEYDEWRYW